MKKVGEKKKKYIWIIGDIMLLCLIAVYLIMMPQVILEQLEENPYNEFIKTDYPEKASVLTLWHIVEFKPYSGSLSSYFTQYSSQFEKKHNGVFAEVSAMTVDEYRERVKRGESADIYSFPLSLSDEMPLCAVPYDEKKYSFPVSGYGIVSGERIAVPYALSGEFLVCNSAMIQKKDIQINKENAAEFAEGAEAQELFLEGKAAMTVMDAGTLGTTERRYNSGKGFAVEAYPMASEYTLVQLIGISKDADKIDKENAAAYIDELFSKEQTEKLCSLGMIPVIECDDANIEFESVYIRQLYELLNSAESKKQYGLFVGEK
ncbi:MAG: hypothetical protein IJO48_00975 [Clostridia bacterium]|nr:hypothetical protein [Clostridia bacterium]